MDEDELGGGIGSDAGDGDTGGGDGGPAGWSPTEDFMEDLAGRVASKLAPPPQQQTQQPQERESGSLIEGNEFLMTLQREMQSSVFADLQPMLMQSAMGALRVKHPQVPNEALQMVEAQLATLSPQHAQQILRTPGSLEMVMKNVVADMVMGGKWLPSQAPNAGEPVGGGGNLQFSQEARAEIDGFERIAGRKPTAAELKDWGVG